MVYFNGEYHLFFQHNPYGWDWGNMHWGHAVSKDMVHWEELGDKLLPDELGPMFSGSAVVDHAQHQRVRQGRQAAAGARLHRRRQPDGAVPRLQHRRPHVHQVRQEPGGEAGHRRQPRPEGDLARPDEEVGDGALRRASRTRHTVHFYTSPDLKEWTLASVTEGGTDGKDGYLFECPDLFELPVDGDAKQSKWVLLGANSEYAVGTFDGTTFKPETDAAARAPGQGLLRPADVQRHPGEDGRRIQIGWFQTPTPGMPFNQSMTDPAWS